MCVRAYCRLSTAISLLAPRIVGGSGCLCAITAPGIPLFLSRVRRGAQWRRDVAGEQPPDAHTHTETRTHIGYTREGGSSILRTVRDPQPTTLSLSLSFSVCVCLVSRSPSCRARVRVGVMLNVDACVILSMPAARICRGWSNWKDRRTRSVSSLSLSPSLPPRSPPLSLAALKRLQEVAQSKTD